MRYAGTLPSARLKIAGIEFNSFGDATAEGEGILIRRRMDAKAGIYERLAIQGGKIIGAIMLGDSRKAMAIKKLIEGESEVSGYEGELLEDDFDLKALASV
jgi:nitrite reductase (NADH) large subunit